MDSFPTLPLDPRRLETFRRVAIAGSVSAAARLMALSQPAVTAQIRALEGELGQALFTRGRDGMRLTEPGIVLMDIARRLHDLLAEAVRDVAHPPRLGPLEVGASTTAAAYLLPPLLSIFLHDHPAIPVRVVTGNTEDMLSAVREGRIPLALVEGLPRAPGLTQMPYVSDELVLVGPSGLPNPPQKVADLARHRLLWREQGSGTRAVVERALGRARCPLPSDLDLGNTEAIKTAVIHGLGLGFLSRLSIQRETNMGLLSVLPLSDLHIPRTFTWVRGAGAMPPSAEALFHLGSLQSPLGSGQ